MYVELTPIVVKVLVGTLSCACAFMLLIIICLVYALRLDRLRRATQTITLRPWPTDIPGWDRYENKCEDCGRITIKVCRVCEQRQRGE